MSRIFDPPRPLGNRVLVSYSTPDTQITLRFENVATARSYKNGEKVTAEIICLQKVNP
jgi:hypothetical protein